MFSKIWLWQARVGYRTGNGGAPEGERALRKSAPRRKA